MAGVIQFYRAGDANGVFSNYYLLDAPVTNYGYACATSEHGYQLAKYRYEGAGPAEDAYAALIAAAGTPHQAKFLANRGSARQWPWQQALGRLMDAHPAAPDPGWRGRSLDAMRAVLDGKFWTNAHCRAALLATYDCRLVNASPDPFWGAGADRRGANWLGRLLMETRARLQHAGGLAD